MGRVELVNHVAEILRDVPNPFGRVPSINELRPTCRGFLEGTVPAGSLTAVRETQDILEKLRDYYRKYPT
jgi:hypothetical protein